MSADRELIDQWVRRFLKDHILWERNLSKNTQKGYRDSLHLLFSFVSDQCRRPIDSLALEDITKERLKLFLQHLEKERGCSIATRNQRLAAIRAWARFIGSNNSEYLVWCNDIRGIPFKKAELPQREYMTKQETDALLSAPDRDTDQGRRDYALLLFMYNTGARADEIASLTIDSLRMNDSPPCVRLLGKGRKVRMCPLWSLTIDTLTPLIAGRASHERLFLNRCRQPITRFGIFSLVRRHVSKASESTPSLSSKRISPHSIRHTTAMHLLKAGIDINTIRDWLGHVSVDTTNIYTEIDLEMKAKALSHCEIFEKTRPRKQWRKNGVLQFLKSIGRREVGM
ncbi:MAG: tyrosine-type recombinase/integrase [Actinobacteria bacterium]|nr:tyrosine-type recombinase/integrase [Actinomycetota bacterium]